MLLLSSFLRCFLLSRFSLEEELISNKRKCMQDGQCERVVTIYTIIHTVLCTYNTLGTGEPRESKRQRSRKVAFLNSKQQTKRGEVSGLLRCFYYSPLPPAFGPHLSHAAEQLNNVSAVKDEDASYKEYSHSYGLAKMSFFQFFVPHNSFSGLNKTIIKFIKDMCSVSISLRLFFYSFAGFLQIPSLDGCTILQYL